MKTINKLHIFEYFILFLHAVILPFVLMGMYFTKIQTFIPLMYSFFVLFNILMEPRILTFFSNKYFNFLVKRKITQKNNKQFKKELNLRLLLLIVLNFSIMLISILLSLLILYS